MRISKARFCKYCGRPALLAHYYKNFKGKGRYRCNVYRKTCGRKECVDKKYETSVYPSRICINRKTTARCQSCGEEFLMSGFRQKWCKKCNPDNNVYGNILHKYNIGKPDYDLLVKLHNGKCWICNESPAVIVDHCHKTGRIRGLLCVRCNVAIGYLEDAVLVEKGLMYLRQGNGGFWTDVSQTITHKESSWLNRRRSNKIAQIPEPLRGKKPA